MRNLNLATDGVALTASMVAKRSSTATPLTALESFCAVAILLPFFCLISETNCVRLPQSIRRTHLHQDGRFAIVDRHLGQGDFHGCEANRERDYGPSSRPDVFLNCYWANGSFTPCGLVVEHSQRNTDDSALSRHHRIGRWPASELRWRNSDSPERRSPGRWQDRSHLCSYNGIER